jgi:magnesium-transporting ATPase (P-type)
MKGSGFKKMTGIAGILQKTEIKEYFDTLFILVGGIEFVIFIAHFIGSMGADKGPFPWKQYFFVSFMAPVVLMFIIGLIVIGFNYYLYGSQQSAFDLDESPFVGTKMKRFGHSFKFLFSIIQQVPVLAGLFILGIASVVLFKLDVILKVLGHIGEKTAFYLFILLCVLASGALIFLIFWLYWQFKLQKFNIQREWEYKQKVIEMSGLIILDDNTVFNKKGEVISYDKAMEVLEDKKINGPQLPKKLLLK